MKRIAWAAAALPILLTAGWIVPNLPTQKSLQPDAESVERSRREIKLLDDLYKTAVVLVNDTYVEDPSDPAAGEIFRDLFDAMREKGWHDARLIDATGKPINKENKPRDLFEEAGVKALLSGKPYFEQITREKDKHFLRAVTLVPVVNKKCIMCHPGLKVGDVLGGISYKLEIK